MAGDEKPAREMIARASEVFRSLLDPSNLGSLIDWAVLNALTETLAERSADPEALAARDKTVEVTDLPPAGMIGMFRKRMLPLVLSRLERIHDQADLELRARIEQRVLTLTDVADPAEISRGKVRSDHAREGSSC